MTPRVALLGFSIECNRFAPVATEAVFTGRVLLEGEAILADARSAAPRALGEMPGFLAETHAAGPWAPDPLLLAMAEPNGPVDQGFFARLMTRWAAGLRALEGTVDGVHAVPHGAGRTTALDDPEGALRALVHAGLGEIPFVCSHDLHANVSDANVARNDAFLGCRTNPRLDMRARGAESARLRLGTVEVVVIEGRTPCADPAFLEHLGADLAAGRAPVVKPRGHVRGGFDEFFDAPRIVEVDAPGLTSPILARFAWTRLPRPVLPPDPETSWR